MLLLFLRSVFALPYMILFFVVWTVSSVAKPVLVAAAVCSAAVHPAATVRKLQLTCWTIQYLLFCNDKKWNKKKKKSTTDRVALFEQAAAAAAAAAAKTNKKNDDANNSSSDDKHRAVDDSAAATTTSSSSAEAAATIEVKTVVFVRHGESTWNDTFNRGDRSKLSFVFNFVPNLLTAAATEWYFWCSGAATESWFFDAPLSPKGIQQAERVRDFLRTNPEYVTPKEAAYLKLLTGSSSSSSSQNEENNNNSNSNKVKRQNNDESAASCTTPTSQLVSSNLRRAISTIAIGFQDRLQKERFSSDDKILILPELQEMSSNPDALCITPPGASVQQSWTDPVSLRHLYDTTHTNNAGRKGGEGERGRIDCSLHTGNKHVRSSGLDRMESFCDTIFTSERLKHKDAIICGGHSYWFRAFFQTYLPESFDHVSKRKKLINGGMVGFRLQRVVAAAATAAATAAAGEDKKDQYHYMIDPTSVTILHGGF